MKLCFPSLRRRLWDNAAISPRHSKLDKIHTRRTTRVKAPKPFANERRPGDITNYQYFPIAVFGVTQQHRLQRETIGWGGYPSKMKMREKLHKITLVRVLKATKVLRIRDGGRGLPLLYVFVDDALRASPLLSEHRPGNTKFVRELYVYVPHRSYIAFHFRNRRSNFPRGGKRRLRHDRGKNILLRGGIALPSSGCLELLARLSMAKAARVTGKLRYPAVSTTSASV